MIRRTSLLIALASLGLAACSTGPADFDGPPDLVAAQFKICTDQAAKTKVSAINPSEEAGARHAVMVFCMKEHGYPSHRFEGY